MKDDLARFNCRPEKSEKMSIMIDKVCAAAQDLWMKNVVSSAYCNNGTPDGTLDNWKPVRDLLRHNCKVHTAKASAARMNNNGANGQPCRIPRWGWIQLPCGRPCTKMIKVGVVTHCFTQRTHVSGNPRRRRTFHKNCQSKVSYALEKSTFHIKPGVSLRRHAATISYASTML